MMSMPLVTAADLRQASRHPVAPFRLCLDNGDEVTVLRLLRVLPGKRVVGEGRLRDTPVLIKLFIATASERHWQREHSGLSTLIEAGIPTPEILGSGRLASGGHYLLTAYLENAATLATTSFPAERLLTAARLIATMHRRGLMQTDLHLGNFLCHGDNLYMIDGDGIEVGRAGRPLAKATALSNLALFLAQFPLSQDDQRGKLVAAYREACPDSQFDDRTLTTEIARTRTRRLHDYLGKCVRDCSLFKVETRLDRFTAVVRAEEDRLAPILADPDALMAQGTALKTGRTCTVVRVELDGRPVVIKRYNIKNPGHAISRAMRPSRAWHAWLEGHRLSVLGIATPAPLALIERRFGPLRGTAWLITQFVEAHSLDQHWPRDQQELPPEPERLALARLFLNLHSARLTHGDMKATNLLWHDNGIMLIDLDAMTYHAMDIGLDRATRRDIARLQQNWPAGSALRIWLEKQLSWTGNPVFLPR
jgi:tRNA A-37 threonylcarbamoyl transferase component Bud32